MPNLKTLLLRILPRVDLGTAANIVLTKILPAVARPDGMRLKTVEGEVVSEIGVRFYCLEYVRDRLIQAKVEAMGLPFSEGIIGDIATAMERFHKNGLFMVRVIDEANLGVLRASFLENKNLEVGVKVNWADARFQVVVDPAEAVRFLCPRAVRDIYRKELDRLYPPLSNPGKWLFFSGPAGALIDRFYQDELVLTVVSPGNAREIQKALEEEHDADLKIRLR